MSGIMFPDFAGSLAKAASVENAMAQSNYLDEDRKAKASAAPFVAKALQGDKDALNEIGVRHPDTVMKLAPILERLDAATRAKAKEASDYTVQTGMAILNADPAQQPALYARAREDAAARGMDVSKWPTQYDAGWVKFNVDKAMPFAEHFKRQRGDADGVTFAAPVGGGAAPATAGGVNPNNIGNVRPPGASTGFQQPASFEEGVQIAVNNVKAYPAKFNGGQPMTLMQIGQRWAPKGDGANDPAQWARNVASIGGLDPNKPLDFNDPATAVAFARGVHGAEHGAGKVQPPEVYARALTVGQPQAAPSQVAQGSDMPADASGTPLPPAQQALQPLRGLQLPPGARVALRKGLPVIEGGNVLYVDAQGNWGAAPLPQRAEPKAQGAGPFTGTSTEAQALNMLIANGTLNQQQAAELAAGKTITNPADGSVLFMTPSGIFGQKQGQQPQPVGGATPGMPSPSGAPPTGAMPQPGSAVPGGIQVTPAKRDPAFKKLETEVMAVNSAIDNFNNILKESGGGTFGAFINNPQSPEAQKILGAFNALKTALRSEAFVNTGVLQPAEMSMLDNMLLAPTTLRGLFSTPEAYAAMLDQIKQFVEGKMNAARGAYGVGGGSAPAAPAPAVTPKVGTVEGGYLFKGGDPSKPESWEKAP